jgi:hypothetical protein
VELWVGIALLAGLLVVRHFAARQVARGRRGFVWIYFAPTLAVIAYLVWVPAQMWAEQPLLAVGIGLMGITTLILAFRTIREMASGEGLLDPKGGPSKPFEDYTVWMAIAPFLVVGVLILLLVTGGLDSAR